MRIFFVPQKLQKAQKFIFFDHGFDFVFLLLARNNSSELGSPLARASVLGSARIFLFELRQKPEKLFSMFGFRWNLVLRAMPLSLRASSYA